MNQRRNFIAAIVGAAFVLGAGVASAQTKWDMPTPYPDGNFHTKNVVQFAQDVAKSSGGKLQITAHSNASLIKHAGNQACGADRSGADRPDPRLGARQRIGRIRIRFQPLLRQQLSEGGQAVDCGAPGHHQKARFAGPDAAVRGTLAAAGRVYQEGAAFGGRPERHEVPHLQSRRPRASPNCWARFPPRCRFPKCRRPSRPAWWTQ